VEMRIIKIIKIFLQASNKDKKEIIKYFYKKKKQKLIDYFFGFAVVNKYYIDDLKGNGALYRFSIIAGRFGKGVLFSQLSARRVNDIIDALKESKPKLELTIEYGCGAYQTYIFNRYQQKCLLKKLEEIVRTEKIYYEK
jgi:hypothetical protein